MAQKETKKLKKQKARPKLDPKKEEPWFNVFLGLYIGTNGKILRGY